MDKINSKTTEEQYGSSSGARQVEMQRAMFFGFEREDGSPAIATNPPDIPTQSLIDPKQFSALPSLTTTETSETHQEFYTNEPEDQETSVFKITPEQYERYRKAEATKKIQAKDKENQEKLRRQEKRKPTEAAEPSKVADASFMYTQPDIIQVSHSHTGLRHVKGGDKVQALATADSLTDDTDLVPRLKFVAKGPSSEGESAKKNVVVETRVTRKDLASSLGYAQYATATAPPRPQNSANTTAGSSLKLEHHYNPISPSASASSDDWRDRGEVDSQPIAKQALLSQWESTMAANLQEQGNPARSTHSRQRPQQNDEAYEKQLSVVRSRFDDLHPVTEKQQANKVRHWEVKAPSHLIVGGSGQLNNTGAKKETEVSRTQRQPLSEEDEFSSGSFSSSEEDVEGESIVEREIRMTLKREASLRRQKQGKKRSEVNTKQLQKECDVAVTIEKEESLQYNAPALPVAETEHTKVSSRSSQQQRRNETRSNNRASRSENGSSRREEVQKRESVIEREIREQREKEEALARQRGLPADQPSEIEQPLDAESEEGSYYSDSEISGSDESELSPESRFATSRIEQELLEQQQREAELRQARSAAGSTSSAHPPGPLTSPPGAFTSSSLSDASSARQRHDSRDSLGSLGASSRSSHEYSDTKQGHSSASQAVSAASPTATKESPIEREIRIAHERETQMRLERGLPLPQLSSDESSGDNSFYEDDVLVEVPSYRSSINVDNDQQEEQNRRLASSRLQREMEEERRRELELRNQGTIRSTSEQYIDEPSFEAQPERKSAAHSESRRRTNRPPAAEHNNNKQRSKPNGSAVKDRRSTGLDSSHVRNEGGSIPSKIQRELLQDRQREEEHRRSRTSMGSISSPTKS